MKITALLSKGVIPSVFGVVGAFIANAFGGWDDAMTTLLIFMGIDYATGLILAGVFHKSKKSKNGAIESGACWKGLCKKAVNLLIVLVAYRLDLMADTSVIKDGVVIAICASEAFSILENVSLMGMPIPKVLRKALEVLQQDENNQVETVEVKTEDGEE